MSWIQCDGASFSETGQFEVIFRIEARVRVGEGTWETKTAEIGHWMTVVDRPTEEDDSEYESCVE